MITLNKYIVAIDGGATKTDMVLCNVDGIILERIIGGPTNPNDIGFEKSVEYLRDMLLRLLNNYGGLKAKLYSFYAGLSGGSVGDNKQRYSLAFKEMLVNTSCIFNGSDAINAMNSGIGCKNGIVLIAGTGSVVFVRNNDEIKQIGGWGYLLDDAGSGYDLGRRGFLAALREYDGRGQDTILSSLYSERLGGLVDKFIPEIYQKGKQYIASFAPLVFEAEAKGDDIAGQILDTCAAELASLVKAGAKYLKDSHGTYHTHRLHQIHYPQHSYDPIELIFPVVLTGGLWKSGDALMKKFKSNLNEEFELVHPELPPVYGAIVEAVVRAKREYGGCDEGEILDCFYENFKEGVNSQSAIKL